MESNERPILYYLVKRGNDEVVIQAATDVQMLELYDNGVRWHGVPFKTKAEADTALAALKQI